MTAESLIVLVVSPSAFCVHWLQGRFQTARWYRPYLDQDLLSFSVTHTPNTFYKLGTYCLFVKKCPPLLQTVFTISWVSPQHVMNCDDQIRDKPSVEKPLVNIPAPGLCVSRWLMSLCLRQPAEPSAVSCGCQHEHAESLGGRSLRTRTFLPSLRWTGCHGNISVLQIFFLSLEKHHLGTEL